MDHSVPKHWMRSRLPLVVCLAMAVGCEKGTPTGAADYTLSLTPAALTIDQGADGTTSVTITSTNFTGAVTLSLGGAPAGVTGSFDPVDPTGTGTSSMLTVSVAAAVAPGVYTLTVDGTGSPGSRSTPLTITVSVPTDYTLSLSPASFTIAPGAEGTTTVNIDRTNFTGAVTLTLGGAAVGVTGSFTPVAPTGTSSTLTVSVGAAVAPGVYDLTVDGTGTAGDRSTPLSLTVDARPDYRLSLDPAALTIGQGEDGTTTVTISRTNFTDAVTLRLANAPAGVTGSFDPAVSTETNSTLTVSVGAAVAPGVYHLTVDGTSTTADRWTPFTLTVEAAPAYTLSLSTPAFTVAPGAIGTTTVTIGRTSFTGAVTLSLDNAPPGVTGSFDPPDPTSTSSTLTVSVEAAVAPGVYNLTVNGTGAAGNRSTPLTLTVSTTPDYALSLAPDALTIAQGANDSTTVAVARSNFPDGVTLTVENVPAGVSGVFNPTPATGATSTLTVSVGAAAAAGTYTLTVRGSATGLTDRQATLTVTVTTAASYRLSLAPAALTIAQGSNAPTTVNIDRTSFAGGVTLTIANLPPGVSGVFNPTPATSATSTLTVSVGTAAAAGTYALTVRGTATGLTDRTAALTLTVVAASDYALSLSPAALTVVPGANGHTTVNITRTNFAGAVNLRLGGAPAGIIGSFDPAAPTGNSSTLTVSVAAGVAPGVYNLTVDGTGIPGSRSTPFTLSVTPSGGSGNVTMDFSTCPVENRPVWLAYQDGTGAWAPANGVNDVYRFNITTGRGGVAYVLLGQLGASSVVVQYSTQAELTAAPGAVCPGTPAGKTVNGNVAGVDVTGGDVAEISLGGGSARVTDEGPFQITDVADGTHDLVAYRRSLFGGAESAIIRRDLNIANNGSVEPLDFDEAEAFAPATATITVGGLRGGEQLTHDMDYHVAACTPATLYSSFEPVVGSSFTASGIPTERQRVGDFHSITIRAEGAGDIRGITESFHTFAARTLTLGASLPPPTISPLAGPYKRLQAAYTLPMDYQGLTGFTYGDDAGKSVSLSATFGYLGGATVTLALADYSGLVGWDNNWAPVASASPVSWTITGFSTFTLAPCMENARFKFALESGTF